MLTSVNSSYSEKLEFANNFAEKIFGDINVKDFRSQYLAKKNLFVNGHEHKFNGVFGWSDINHILETHRLNYPRLRIVNQGIELKPDKYIKKTNLTNGDVFHKAIPEAIIQELNNGSTLVLDRVNEMHFGMQLFSDLIEQIVHETVHANLYLCTSADSYGFDVHWDDHDVIILQLEGQKQWSVYEGKGYNDSSGTIAAQPGELIWKKTLQKGDLLYLPKGTWHLAEAKGVTMHFTLGFTNKTNLDILKWLYSEANRNDFFYNDFLKFSDEGTLKDWEDRFKEEIQKILLHLDLNKYKESTKIAKAQTIINFPFSLDSADDSNVALKGATILRWLLVKQDENYEIENGDLILRTSEKKIHLSIAAAPLIDILKNHIIISYEKLVLESLKLGFEENIIQDFCFNLLRQRILTIASNNTIIC